MSRFILGNCVDIMSGFPERAVDFILTDPPYLVGFSLISRQNQKKTRIRRPLTWSLQVWRIKKDWQCPWSLNWWPENSLNNSERIFGGDCTITASSVSSSRIKKPRNMPEKRMKLKNSAVPDEFYLSLAGFFSCRVMVFSGQCVWFFICR